MMDHAELQKLLASGDVDALRRLLNRESNEEAATVAAPPSSNQSADRLRQPSTLFASRPSVRLSIGAFEVLICNHRSMGKLLWPAGQAIAEMLAGVAPAAAAPGTALPAPPATPAIEVSTPPAAPAASLRGAGPASPSRCT